MQENYFDAGSIELRFNKAAYNFTVRAILSGDPRREEWSPDIPLTPLHSAWTSIYNCLKVDALSVIIKGIVFLCCRRAHNKMAIKCTGWISLLILGLLQSAAASVEVGDKDDIIMSEAFVPHLRNVSIPVSTTRFLLLYSPLMNAKELVRDMYISYMYKWHIVRFQVITGLRSLPQFDVATGAEITKAVPSCNDGDTTYRIKCRILEKSLHWCDCRLTRLSS